jgi:type IV secretion system protein VirB2
MDNHSRALGTLARRYGAPLLTLAVAGLPILAHAQTVTGGTDPSTIINNIATFILGPFGQAIAILAVIAVGFAFMFGRLGIFLLAGVVGGLILIFGSSYLVTQFIGGAGAG